MGWVLGIFLLLVTCFCFVLFFGPPYLPTLTKSMNTALDMVDLKAGETLLELGCGDGKVLIAAAKRGWQAVGYELNPLLALLAWARTRRYGKQVKVVWANFWAIPLPPASGIFIFMLQSRMAQLDKKIMQDCKAPVKLVSFAFTVPGKRPVEKRGGIYRYDYP